jgi:hypothetical protein
MSTRKALESALRWLIDDATLTLDRIRCAWPIPITTRAALVADMRLIADELARPETGAHCPGCDGTFEEHLTRRLCPGLPVEKNPGWLVDHCPDRNCLGGHTADELEDCWNRAGYCTRKQEPSLPVAPWGGEVEAAVKAWESLDIIAKISMRTGPGWGFAQAMDALRAAHEAGREDTP